jgi:hypothetical protein
MVHPVASGEAPARPLAAILLHGKQSARPLAAILLHGKQSARPLAAILLHGKQLRGHWPRSAADFNDIEHLIEDLLTEGMVHAPSPRSFRDTGSPPETRS